MKYRTKGNLKLVGCVAQRFTNYYEIQKTVTTTDYLCSLGQII